MSAVYLDSDKSEFLGGKEDNLMVLHVQNIFQTRNVPRGLD